MDLNFFRASAGSGAKVKPPCSANMQHFPVWNAVPGVPRSSTEPKQPVRRIGIHPCRARRPRRAAQQRPRFPQLRANPQHFPVGNVRYPPTLGEFATGQRIRPRFSASYRVLHGKGKPFPYNRRLRMRPRFMRIPLLLPGRRDAAPYIEMLRIRRTWCLSLRRAGSARPTRKSYEFVRRGGHPQLFLSAGFPRYPLPVPPPAGEGVAHKGDRRGRT